MAALRGPPIQGHGRRLTRRRAPPRTVTLHAPNTTMNEPIQFIPLTQLALAFIPVCAVLLQCVGQHHGPVIDRPVRLTLGQERDQQRADRVERRQRRAVGHDRGGARAHRLDAEMPQMLGQPGPPFQRELGARLHHRRELRGFAAPDQPDMAAVVAGQGLDDRARFAVRTDRQQNALVAPVHVCAHSSRPEASSICRPRGSSTSMTQRSGS